VFGPFPSGGIAEWRKLSSDACPRSFELDEVTLKFVSQKSAEELGRTKTQSNGVPENLRRNTGLS
jgi:hypothetical protein